MRVATVDGLVTLFYDGSKPLYNEELHFDWWDAHEQHMSEDDWESWDLSVECKKYFRERFSWQQVIVVEGVTEIPDRTFLRCYNVKRVIFADTVIRIEEYAFFRCESLVFDKLSINLEYIGISAFYGCNLSSVFIPPSCREIGHYALGSNKNLSILCVPQDTQLGRGIIKYSALAKSSPFEVQRNGSYEDEVNDDMNTWIKNLNNGEEFSLHRACSSFQPLKQVLSAIIQEKGLKAVKMRNSAGITPSWYLKENPYTEVTEMEIIHNYLMKMMGECQ